MRTAGPVDREYVLFNKKNIFRMNNYFTNTVCGVIHPPREQLDVTLVTLF